MAQDYNNEQIVKLFGKQMEKLGEKRAAMLKEKVEQKTIIQQRMEQFQAQNKALQEKLDQAIEKAEDTFTDTASALQYDTERLGKKYLSEKKVTPSSISCLTERADISACYKTHKGESIVCDAFVEALSDCANKSITAK